jgi:hypothetical protein
MHFLHDGGSAPCFLTLVGAPTVLMRFADKKIIIADVSYSVFFGFISK